MKKTYIAISIAAILSLSSSIILAEQSNYYVSITAGESEFDSGLDSGTGYALDETDSTWSINLGYDINENVAFEVGYRDLGQASITATNNLTASAYGNTVTINAGSSIKAEADGFTLGMVGKLPVADSFNLNATLGVFFWDAKVTATGSGTVNGTAYAGSYSESDDGTDAYAGIGAKYDINDNFALGLQWTFYDVWDENVDAIEGTLTFSF